MLRVLKGGGNYLQSDDILLYLKKLVLFGIRKPRKSVNTVNTVYSISLLQKELNEYKIIFIVVKIIYFTNFTFSNYLFMFMTE